MKLVTFRVQNSVTHAGIVHDNHVIELPYPTLLDVLRTSGALPTSVPEERTAYPLEEVSLLPPIVEPPTFRDFYAFEQHVKTARAKRGLGMLPEWYQIPTFYFSNTSELYGQNAAVPYPAGSQQLDFELEIACVIGREGKNIVVEEAGEYIAGYTIMNDWSARDFQRQDMLLGLGPGKGKDFATSIGPWLVTPDELASRRTGSVPPSATI